jgi:membrane-associated protease RseP (regulator of RpoE activity)
MTYSCCTRQGAVFAAFIGSMLLPVCSVRAQNPDTPTNKPAALAVQRLNPVSTVAFDSDGATLTDVANVVAAFRDPLDELLGATLQPVGDTLRAQLDLPAGQGLLVAGLRSDGASAQTGLQQNDILVSLAGKPLAAADDLTKQLKSAGEAPVPLKLLRAGKPLVIQVRPVYRVTLGPVAEQKVEYFIGMTIDATDDAVRAQLALPEGAVVVNEVVSDSPAEKAGVKKHDIVLELAGKRIDGPQALARLVQSTQDKPTMIKVLRAGKPVTIPVTAAVRKVEVNPSQEVDVVWTLNQVAPVSTRLRYLNHINAAERTAAARMLAGGRGGDDLRQRLDVIEKDLKALQAAVAKLSESLKANKPANRD